MDRTVSELLANYGYVAVFAGCLLEGETVLLLAGFAAYQGYLGYPAVVAAAFCGGTLSDQSLFFIGRHFGGALFRRYPRLAMRADPARRLLERFHASLSLGVRFMYGLRIVGPISLGMSEIPAWRFSLLNMLGGVIWAALFAGIGFLFGPTLESLLVSFGHREGTMLLFVGVVVALFGLVCWWRANRR